MLLLLSSVLSLFQCEKEQPSPGADTQELAGGQLTISDASANAFIQAAPILSAIDLAQFEAGRQIFDQSWVAAPAFTTDNDGLGPLFNAKACGHCHFKNGRGRPPILPNELGHGLLFHLSTGTNSQGFPIADHNYGDQLQDQALHTVQREATFEVQYQPIHGIYPDGNRFQLRRPIYTMTNLTQGVLQATHPSPRVANQLVGLGLLDAVAESTLLEIVKQQIEQNTTISGQPNYVWNEATQQMEIGKFGWKATHPNLEQQIAASFAQNMGITSSLYPEENCPPSAPCELIPNGGSPELSAAQLADIVAFVSQSGVPAQRDAEDPEVSEGRLLFERINCSSCHRPSLRTGMHPSNSLLADQQIHPYTDLLLHDMGDGLADQSPAYRANGREWRTPPLWGIGLIGIVNGHTKLLHDGRARSLEEAILWHGGEALDSKDAFMQLSAAERGSIITFLKSL